MLQLRRMCVFLVVETELAICLSAGAWRTGCTGTGAGGPSSAASLKRPPQGTGWLAACKLVVGWLGSRAGGPTAFQPRLTPARTLLPWRRGAPSVPPGTACILGAAHPADVVLPAPRHPSPPIDLVTVPSHSITKIGPWPCNHTNRSPARKAHIQRLHSATTVQRWCVPKR
jgi:hypothetical protein